MKHYAVTTEEAYKIIYGLVCAAVDEEHAYNKGYINSLDKRNEFLELANKITKWIMEDDGNGNT